MVLVSVIVPVFNDVAGLQRCLAALARQTLPSDEYEVLVVDNASSCDLSPALSACPQAQLLHEPSAGSYAARNTGLTKARGRLLAFTDADCTPQETWLENAVRHLQRGTRDAVIGGRIDVYARDPKHPTCAEHYDLALAFPQRFYIERRGYSVTANLITTRRIMSHVGLFDATLKSAGDKEWCQRAVGQGFTLLYADDVVVEHPARRSLSALVNKRRRQVGGQLEAARRRYPTPVAYGMILGKVLSPPGMRLVRALSRSNGNCLTSLHRSSVVLGVSAALSLGASWEVLSQACGSEAKR